MGMDFRVKIPVIDIFAGPGGLGEGFSSFSVGGYHPFEIKMSVEKDPQACKTLKLRSFFRKVYFDFLKPSYVEFLKSERSVEDEEKLYSNFEQARDSADEEIFCRELGKKSFPPELIDKIIKNRIRGSKTWILIGGPPCQAYSTAGRSRMSQVRKNRLSAFESDERHYLYQHYLRIIASHEPPVFVMENVKGLLSSSIKGKLIIEQILKDLKSPGDNGIKYRLFPFVKPESNERDLFDPEYENFKASDFLIRAEDYGIPQMRHRLIILGVRSDISEKPDFLKKDYNSKTVGEILYDLPRIRSGIGLKWDRTKSWGQHINEIKELLDDEKISENVKNTILNYIDQLGVNLSKGGAFVKYSPWRPKKFIKNWYRTPDLGGVTNHEARYHMPADLRRYFFAACFGLAREKEQVPESPKLRHFPEDLLPNHKNIDRDKTNNAIFDDRFRVQLRTRPSTTVTSHISKDGHYYIHPDPTQCRSLTVREAARLQTFPDSYIFLGSKTSQYTQVGNAVPPKLAIQLAEIVYDLFCRWRED
jgi:DNA (cytosine-5)-methyltransferase 1